MIFFTKESPKIDINSQGKKLTKDMNNNYVFMQIHMNNISFTSEFNSQRLFKADGLICDSKNQNLWIYTNEFMPILFADKY